MEQQEGQEDEAPSSFRKRGRQDEAIHDDGTEITPDRHDDGDDAGGSLTNKNKNGDGHVETPPADLPLPPELATVDFTQRVCWGKYSPYSDVPIKLVPEGEPPVFTEDSPALCHHVNGISNRARACTIHLRPQYGQGRQHQQQGRRKKQQRQQSTASSEPVTTPMFMPVGTKGCLKALTYDEWTTDPALSFPIVLANTYHLALQPGTELLREFKGLHAFQGQMEDENDHDDEKREDHKDEGDAEIEPQPLQPERRVPYNLLTDSGGFQMVSLAKLSNVTEEGVSFENPFKTTKVDGDGGGREMMLLTPEDSIRHQNNIGANIIMALDDVVSSVVSDPKRFVLATHRTLRWYDRCYEAHSRKDTQNLFPIVQGGLDSSLGGLREQCLAGFRHRQLNVRYQTPGYAIGGLAGGESKDEFWKVVDQCCRALPDDKPRYLMGVGYPLDLVVCTALGVDMYDCVYPTRTARFGVCLVPGLAPGTLRLKAHEFADDMRVIQQGCQCQACREGVSRARLHGLLKAGNVLAVELVTQHNLAHMMFLVRSMRQAILRDEFGQYARNFVREQYPGKHNGGEDPPGWVVDALAATGIHLTQ